MPSDSNDNLTQTEKSKAPSTSDQIPEELKKHGIGLGKSQEAASRDPRTRESHPGYPEPTSAKSHPYVPALLAVIAVLIGIIFWITGKGTSQNIADFFDWLSPRASHEVTMLDSRNGVVLMLERSGKTNRIIVQTADEASWLLVSQDDTTVKNPALSMNGTHVAYVSELDDGQIVIVPLNGDDRYTLSADDVKDAGKNDGFDELAICSWTPLAWAPDNDMIAFFGCAEDNSLSVVITADLTTTPPDLDIIGNSRINSSDERQLRWLDDAKLVVSSPAVGQQPATITTFEVR
jgi:hypothetical protein